VRIIEYLQDNKTKIHTIKYDIDTYSEQTERIYKWEYPEPEEYRYKIDSPELISEEENLRIDHAEIINLQDQIYNTVISNGLYRFGKFLIREDEISLGWVSINKLLSERNDLLQDIIRSLFFWIRRKMDGEIDNTLLVGVDFWGTIIASNLSVMTGLKSYCKANRGKESHFTDGEIFNDLEGLSTDKIRNLVIITDVVSSGKSLTKVYDFFENKFAKKGGLGKILAIGIVVDRNQRRKADLSFLSAFGTFCGKIKIPVIPSDMLPDDDLLPSQNYLL
jgi:orotate phosphoribosyltransferase